MKMTLKSARVAKNYTQAQMASILRVDQGTFSRWERNPDIIQYGMLKKICRLLGVNLMDLEG